MNLAALLALILSGSASAASISDSPYYLEITAPAGSIGDAGPAPYADWFYGPGYGEIGYLIFTAVPQGIVTSFGLLPCPTFGPCPPVRDSMTVHGGTEQAPAETPEPDSRLLFIAAGIVGVPLYIRLLDRKNKR